MVETDDFSSHGIFIAGAVAPGEMTTGFWRNEENRGKGGQLHNTSEVLTHKKPNPKTM